MTKYTLVFRFSAPILILFTALLAFSVSAQDAEFARKKCVDVGFKVGATGYEDCVKQYLRSSGGTVFNKPITKPSSPTPLANPISTEFTLTQRDDKFWEGAVASGNKEAFEAYLSQYPQGQYAGLAKANILRLDTLSRANASSQNIKPSLSVPENTRASAPDFIETEREDKFWDDAKSIGNKEAYIGYLETYQNGKYSSLAKANLARLAEIEAKRPAQNASARESKLVGSTFRDCDQCPEMVVLPKGRFIMGSPETEIGREKDEGPQREIVVNYDLAVGKFEVTFDEWGQCANDSGGRNCDWYDPPTSGWGGGRQPVVEITWDRAQLYVKWLSKKTGKRYRLLTEAEWEYAARAGTTSRYYFGNCFDPKKANVLIQFSGNAAAIPGEPCENISWFPNNRPLAVGTFPPNAFGLHDMAGNVLEWVQDCWKSDYSGLTTDAKVAYEPEGCMRRVHRGGSWFSSAAGARSAARSYAVPLISTFSSRVGFRIARTLE